MVDADDAGYCPMLSADISGWCFQKLKEDFLQLGSTPYGHLDADAMMHDWGFVGKCW